MNLMIKTSNWQKAGIISKEQQTAIMAYESENNRLGLFSILMFISAFCIGLGILALIASNWDAIPNTVKLGADFILLLAAAGYLIKAFLQNKPFLKESMILLYALLILGSIGLIAQIYQLHPNGLAAFLLWSVLTIPLLFLTQKALFPLFWVPAAAVPLYDRLEMTAWFQSFLGHLNNAFPFGGLIFGIITVIVTDVFLQSSRHKFPAIFKAFRFWLIILIGTAVLWMDFTAEENGNWLRYSGHKQTLEIIPWLATAALWGCGWIWNRLRQENSLALSLGLTILIWALLFGLLPAVGLYRQLGGMMLTLILLSELLYRSYLSGQFKRVNLAAGLIGLRIFLAYLQVFGSLLATGSGLLISGLLLAAILYLLKYLTLKGKKFHVQK